MSLSGSLDTFSLDDVLTLLASTKKVGELRVSSGKLDAHVWFEKGEVVHARLGSREQHPVDVVWEILRRGVGSFVFDSDNAAPSRAEPQVVEIILGDAHDRLAEWKEIERIVPHLDAVIDMAAEAPAGSVTVSSEQWSLLRIVAGGMTVRDLMSRLSTSEFDTCKTVKGLVDERLAGIDSTRPRPKPKEEPADTEGGREDRESDRAQRADSAAERVAAAAAKLLGEDDKGPADKSYADKGVAKEVPTKPASRPGDDAAERRNGHAAAEPVRPKVRATTSAVGEPAPPRPTAKPPAGTVDDDALAKHLADLGATEEEAAQVKEHLEAGELHGDEPINRGLLLKFLSSVRN